jgi:hypothetical protein
MFGELGFFQILHFSAALLSQIGLLLFGIGAWKFYLITHRRGYVVMVVAIGINLALSMFWWCTSMLWDIVPRMDDILLSLFQNDIAMDTIWFVDMAAGATAFLALAWEFVHQLKAAPKPHADS